MKYESTTRFDISTNYSKTSLGEGELTNAIEEGDELPGHAEWKVIETKGHAQSHVSFFCESDGAFIGGDHLLSHMTPNPILEPSYDGKSKRPKPLLQYRKNVKKCLDLGIDTVYPGHGEVFSNLDELIPAQFIRQKQRADKVFDMLRKKSETPFELCQKVFPKQFSRQLDLTMSETVSQLDFLEYEDKIAKECINGILYYHAK